MVKETLIRADPCAPGTPGADERLRVIVARVNAHGFQSVDRLSSLFGVSPQTIRRDVNILCDRGLGRRRHGGIDVLPGQNIGYGERLSLAIDAKRRIARRVADAVADGASLFFGIGTTPEQCAKALTSRARLRVMTNNLNVAMAMRRNASCELTIAGGRLRNADGDVVAGEAHGFFAGFSVDIGIYGVGGVADDGSLLDFNDDEMLMRRQLVAHCRQRFLVLDHSKFGRGATVRGGHITEATHVFTDQAVPAPILTMLEKAGVALIVASSSPPL